jgi:dephospho-CoA kinase
VNLQKTDYLDKYILDQLIDYIENNSRIIIDGIRQPYILYNLIDFCKYHSIAYQLFWVYACKQTRYQRFYKRNNETQSFEEAEQGDCNLGIDEIENFILNNGTILNNNKDITNG